MGASSPITFADAAALHRSRRDGYETDWDRGMDAWYQVVLERNAHRLVSSAKGPVRGIGYDHGYFSYRDYSQYLRIGASIGRAYREKRSDAPPATPEEIRAFALAARTTADDVEESVVSLPFWTGRVPSWNGKPPLSAEVETSGDRSGLSIAVDFDYEEPFTNKGKFLGKKWNAKTVEFAATHTLKFVQRLMDGGVFVTPGLVRSLAPKGAKTDRDDFLAGIEPDLPREPLAVRRARDQVAKAQRALDDAERDLQAELRKAAQS